MILILEYEQDIQIMLSLLYKITCELINNVLSHKKPHWLDSEQWAFFSEPHFGKL